MVQVDQALCAGCGICVDSCPVEAIRLVNQRAVINDAQCTQCEACHDTCPNGAIVILSTPVPSSSTVSPTPIRATQSEIISLANSRAPLAEAVLSFLSSEVAPRLVDALAKGLERKLVQLTTTAPVAILSLGTMAYGRGERRQVRRRGRRAGVRKYRERRCRIFQGEIARVRWVPVREPDAAGATAMVTTGPVLQIRAPDSTLDAEAGDAAGSIVFMPAMSRVGFRPQRSRKPPTSKPRPSG